MIYSDNFYGPYSPANQIAVYDYQDGFKWLIAGDDLPSISGRSYRVKDSLPAAPETKKTKKSNEPSTAEPAS